MACSKSGPNVLPSSQSNYPAVVLGVELGSRLESRQGMCADELGRFVAAHSNKMGMQRLESLCQLLCTCYS